MNELVCQNCKSEYYSFGKFNLDFVSSLDEKKTFWHREYVQKRNAIAIGIAKSGVAFSCCFEHIAYQIDSISNKFALAKKINVADQELLMDVTQARKCYSFFIKAMINSGISIKLIVDTFVLWFRIKRPTEKCIPLPKLVG